MAIPTLFLIGFWADYEMAFFSNIKSPSFDIVLFNPKLKLEQHKAFKSLPRPIRNWIYRKNSLKLIHSHPKAVFILQDNRLFLELLLKKKPPILGGILMRNIVNKANKIFPLITRLQVLGYQFWSFDQEDCQKYKFKYQPQFISKIPIETTSQTDFDFVFIGQDKGRKAFLLSFSEQMKTLGYKTLIEIKDATASNKQEQQIISYKQYLEQQNKAKCILDFVQGKQSGMTLRPLEALIYKQKLISNNAALKDSNIYNEANIFIISEECTIDFAQLAVFMQTPMIEIAAETIKQYSTQCVLEKIIDDSNQIDDL